MILSPGQVTAPRGQIILGREPSRASWVLAHPSVSGLHATIVLDQATVQDHADSRLAKA